MCGRFCPCNDSLVVVACNSTNGGKERGILKTLNTNTGRIIQTLKVYRSGVRIRTPLH